LSEYQILQCQHIFMQNHTINGGALRGKCLVEKSDYQVLAYDKGKIVGFIAMSKFPKNHYIRQIVVEKEYQQQGVSKLLLTALINHTRGEAEGIVSNCYKDNIVSIKMHESFGFKKSSESESQYYYTYNIKEQSIENEK